MSPFLLQILGVLVRSALTSLTGVLVANHYLTADQSESFSKAAFEQVMRYAPAAIALGWSLYQKYKNRLRLIAALELPAGAEEDDAKALAQSPAIKRQIFSGVACVLLAASAASAQPHHTMPIEVQADKILIGTEFVPRRLDAAAVLHVNPGSTVTLPADSTWDYIEVAGTLRCDRMRDTVLRFTHFIVLPGGALDCGTVTDPIPATRRVRFLVNDVALDTTRDPFQWGNGLLNFGTQTRVGASKTPWVEATGSLAAGATTLTLMSAPQGWQVGDELLLPDTVSPPYLGNGRREARVTVAAIAGTTLTLSKPLDFAHPTITAPDGTLVLRPRIANLTRNIVLASASPDRPGHTADIGHDASWVIRSNQFVTLGRTKAVALDDTVLGTKIGTNQRGKYAEHHHHNGSAAGSEDVNNSYQGGGVLTASSKWGLVAHATSDALFEGNVCVDFPGACIVTEDGYEVRNVFRNNLAAFSIGNNVDAQGNVTLGCPGCEGDGFWFRGIQNTFEGNEAWNNVRGVLFLNQQFPVGLYPSAPGVVPDTTIDASTAVPVRMIGNVAAANSVTGYEPWATPRFPVENLIAASNTSVQVMSSLSDHMHLYLRGLTAVCVPETHAIAVHAGLGYTQSTEIDRGSKLLGCEVGVARGGGSTFLKLTDTTVQAEIGIDLLTRVVALTNTLFVPLGNHPPRYLDFGDGSIWNGSDPLPNVGAGMYFPQLGSSVTAVNWQLSGQDYRLFYRQQLGSNPSWYSAPNRQSYNTPEPGLTMLQSWEKYGLSYRGDVLKESEAVTLDGLVNGLARRGLTVPFGPPRAICSFPTLREPAVVVNGAVFINCQLTGDPTAASDLMALSVDGDPPFFFGPGQFTNQTDRSFNTPHVEPGLHEVKVWRTKKDTPGEILPESVYASRYCVGTCDAPPPPPPPPPPVCKADEVLVGGVCVPKPQPPQCLPPSMLVNGQCVAPPPPPPPPPVETRTTFPLTIQRVQKPGEPDRWLLCVGSQCVELPK